MAQSIGNELFFDGVGRCVMQPEPTLADTPVASIAETENMIAIVKSLDRVTAFNRVIAIGQTATSDAVYRGVATDDDPDSPSQYGGPFGKKPTTITSEFITSNSQATKAAKAVLAANIGVAQAVSFAALPDPRLEVGDAVTIVNTVLGIDQVHLIDTLEIGLAADMAMTGTTRTNQETD